MFFRKGGTFDKIIFFEGVASGSTFYGSTVCRNIPVELLIQAADRMLTWPRISPMAKLQTSTLAAVAYRHVREPHLPVPESAVHPDYTGGAAQTKRRGRK